MADGARRSAMARGLNATGALPLPSWQPRQPRDLGYYDLRIPGQMRRQAELAQHYGIHGFAFYYYRLARQRILELPLEQVLADAEWTIEANPESATDPVLEAAVASGVGRISLGIQSFEDAALECLGRLHDEKTAPMPPHSCSLGSSGNSLPERGGREQYRSAGAPHYQKKAPDQCQLENSGVFYHFSSLFREADIRLTHYRYVAGV